MNTYTQNCIKIFIVALFIIAKKWKQPKDLSADEWINQRWYIHLMKYCLATKKEGSIGL
jgi:hypothetical protein